MDSEDQRLVRIESKLDDQNDHLSSIDVTLALQHESLRHHIKRTDQLQKMTERADRHINMVNGALKLLVFIGITLGITEAIHVLLK